MHVELVVPALFPDRESSAGVVRLEGLELLLARGRAARGEPAGFERWLARAFGLGDAALPVGALTALVDGREAGIEPGAEFWLRADPVHLRLMRDRFALLPSADFSISRAEAQALAEALNRHFAESFVLHALHPERWCLRAAGEVALQGEAPLEVAGKDVDAHLPAGSDATRWHALLNEIQMLLHGHAVNAERERRGEPAVNSVWLWGGGRLPRAVSAPWHSVSADEPAALGLARLAGMRHRALPAGAGEWLERVPEEGRHLVVLDGLRAPRALGDFDVLEKRLAALEAQWFVPLLAALKAGRIGMVTVHVPEAGISFETIRGDLRRFWRRARPLADFCQPDVNGARSGRIRKR